MDQSRREVRGDIKLPALYLIDSIVKNVGKDYIPLFTQNIVSTFCSAFEKVDERTRSQMFKLRQTWNDVFPQKKLFALDARVHVIDPAWPITASPQSSIHINPKFIQGTAAASSTSEPPATSTSGDTREELLKKQKTLIELEKRRVELQILETKAILEQEEKKLENSYSQDPKVGPGKLAAEGIFNAPTSSMISQSVLSRDPRIRSKEKTSSNSKVTERSKYDMPLPTQPLPNPADLLNLLSSPIKDSNAKESKEKQFVGPGKTNFSRPRSDPVTASTGELMSGTSLDRKKEVRSSPVKENNELASIKRRKKISSIKKPYFMKKPFDKTEKGIVSDEPVKSIDSKKAPIPTEKPKIAPAPYRGGKRERSKDTSESSSRRRDRKRKEPEPIPEKSGSDKSKSSSTTKSKSPKDSKTDRKKIVPTEAVKTNKETSNGGISTDNEKSPVNRAPVASTSPSNISKEARPTVVVTEPEAIDTLDKKHDEDCDTDLRLLQHFKRTNDSEGESSPSSKRPKTKMIDSLFGNEDVDLRTIHPIQPPQPPTPPPPIISDLDSPEAEKSWANVKHTTFDGTKEDKPKKGRNDGQKKLLYDHKQGSSKTADGEADLGRSDSNCNLIIQQAEEQLSCGNISFSQYNKLLKEVISMNEERKLKEALRKDQADSSRHGSSKSESDKVTSQKSVSDSTENRGSDHGSQKSSSDKPGNEKHHVSKRSKHERFRKNDDSRRGHDGFNNTTNQWSSSFHHSSQSWHDGGSNSRFDRHEPGMRHESSHRWNREGNNSHRQPFEQEQHFSRFNQPVRSVFRDLPPADPHILDSIDKDATHTIIIDGVPREVRYYGEVAVIILSWDDPREITFQPGSRRIIIDDNESFTLPFNSHYRDIVIDGNTSSVRLGSPTREIFIDKQFYEAAFGGPPLQVRICGKMRKVLLEGPSPQVRIGQIKRTDLVGGKINLIVDAKQMFPIFLDAKPQRFEIGGVPFILRFVEALQVVLINGLPFKIEFGGLPVPIVYRGVKHYIRLSGLPTGITPGYVNIRNMEGGRLPSPVPPPAPSPPIISLDDLAPMRRKESQPSQPQLFYGQLPSATDKSVDVLTSIMPSPLTPTTGPTYSLEMSSDGAPAEPTGNSSITSASLSLNSNINVGELFQKLVAYGIVNPVTGGSQEANEDSMSIRPVDFAHPETLKTKQSGLIKRLYFGMQCNACGVRFSPEETAKYSQHLDWHFRQNRREKDSSRTPQSRRWYYDISDWIQFKEIEDLDERAQSWFDKQDNEVPEHEEKSQEEPSVPAGSHMETLCEICRDRFDQFYNEDKEEWHLRGAIRVDDKVYHPLCYEDFKETQTRKQVQDTDLSTESPQDQLEPLVNRETPIDQVEETADCEPSETITLDDDDEDGKTAVDEESFASAKKDLVEAIRSKTVCKDEAEPMVKEEGEEEEPEDDDSDDDILHVEVIERKIETFEIPDDPEDENPPPAQNESTENAEDEEVFDFTNVKIKKEKLDLSEHHTHDATHISGTANIDGNVEFDEAPRIVVPGKIKINIPSAMKRKATSDGPLSPPQKRASNGETSSSSTNSVLDLIEKMQPPPPGEELHPAYIKPKILGTKLTETSPVSKGSELSGLCAIM